MNKIGTITFHWATNYGAIMQAFALQKYLKSIGKETEIIDYVPFRVNTIQKVRKLIDRDFNFFIKEKKFNNFRKNELILSKKKYRNNKSLFNCADNYYTIICGSDQIWNESFTTGAEGKVTLSYFLNFFNCGKKIAYAVSFGTDKLREEVKKNILPEVEKFYKISARENTGKKILEDLNINAEVVLDPSFLLCRDDYNKLLNGKVMPKEEKVFSYIIQNNQSKAIEISNYLMEKFNKNTKGKYSDVCCDLYEWLYYIKNAQIVVTNSFHGIAFSIIFNTAFIVIPVENSGMNDRIVTLLSALGLSNRMVEKIDFNYIDKLINEKIDWDLVNKKLTNLRESSQNFLLNALN